MPDSTTTIVDFIAQHQLTMITERINNRIGADTGDWPAGASHWRVKIATADPHRRDRPSLIVYYSMGSAHKGAPKLPDVLDCVASDVTSVEGEPDWLQWAEDLGATDAAGFRRMRDAYREITDQAAALRQLLGDEATEQLLYNTERL